MSLNKELALSTDMVEPYIRTEWWRSVSNAIYTVTPVSTDPKISLSGYVKSKPFGELVLGLTAFNSQYAKRDRSMIARDCLDLYLIQLIIEGEYRADFGDTNTIVRAGDIFFLDLTQPLDSFKEAGSRITVVVPRVALNKATNNKRLHGTVLRREYVATKLLSNYIMGTHDISVITTSEEIETVQESLIILISIAFNGQNPALINRNGLQISLRQRVLDYIDRNIGNHILSIDAITKIFHVSRSHLYRAFQEDGGIVKIIQDKRLDQAYRMLTNENMNGASIKEICFKCGFPNVSGFIRLFKLRFDITPSEARIIRIPYLNGEGDAVSLHHYLSTLAHTMKLKDVHQSENSKDIVKYITKFHL